MQRTLILVALFCLPRPLYAQDRESSETERAFAFISATGLPPPHSTIAGYSLEPVLSSGPFRPVPANVDPRTVVHALFIEHGITDRASLWVAGFVAQPLIGADVSASALQVGSRLLLLRIPELHVLIDGGAFREFDRAWGAFVQASASYERGPLRIGAMLHAEKVFAHGHDAVDVFAIAGVSLRTSSWLRLGVEYVAQDLEEAFDPEGGAEGGVRHLLGPDAMLALDKKRLFLTTAVVAELERRGVYGRAGVTFVY